MENTLVAAKRAELEGMTLPTLKELAAERGVETRQRSKRDQTQYIKSHVKKALMIELLIQDMLDKGDVNYDKIIPFTGSGYRDVLQIISRSGDVGTILSFLQSDASFFRLEQQDPGRFWKDVFQMLFPEYEGLFDSYMENPLVEWKKLCLWLTWAHRRLIRANSDFQDLNFVQIEGRRDTSLIRPSANESAVPTRAFALANGFYKGRLLALLYEFYMHRNEHDYTIQQARTLDALRIYWMRNILDSGLWYTNIQTVQRGGSYKFGPTDLVMLRDANRELVPGGAEFFIFAVTLASQEKVTFTPFQRAWKSIPNAPRTTTSEGRSIITIGCAACQVEHEESYCLRCKDCPDMVFCSRACGIEHVNIFHK